jgi:hypothetical protein
MPEGTKTSAMPAEKRLRPNNCHRIENARRDPAEQHQDEAIQHLEGSALWSSPPQYVQLLAKGDYLCLERNSRPEEVEKRPLEQLQKVEHTAFIARFGPLRQADGIRGRDNGCNSGSAKTASKLVAHERLVRSRSLFRFRDQHQRPLGRGRQCKGHLELLRVRRLIPCGLIDAGQFALVPFRTFSSIGSMRSGVSFFTEFSFGDTGHIVINCDGYGFSSSSGLGPFNQWSRSSGALGIDSPVSWLGCSVP